MYNIDKFTNTKEYGEELKRMPLFWKNQYKEAEKTWKSFYGIKD